MALRRIKRLLSGGRAGLAHAVGPLLRLGAPTLLLFAILTGCVAAARDIGHDLHTPTYLEPGPDCAQPCWQGLQPGVHNVNQFFFYAREFSPYSIRTEDIGDGVATLVEVATFGALTLGDTVRTLGPPQRVGCLETDHTALFAGQNRATAVDLYWGDGLVVVRALSPGPAARLAPDMLVRSVRYYAPGEPLYEIGTTTGWHGFTTVPPYRHCNPPR